MNSGTIAMRGFRVVAVLSLPWLVGLVARPASPLAQPPLDSPGLAAQVARLEATVTSL